MAEEVHNLIESGNWVIEPLGNSHISTKNFHSNANITYFTNFFKDMDFSCAVSVDNGKVDALYCVYADASFAFVLSISSLEVKLSKIPVDSIQSSFSMCGCCSSTASVVANTIVSAFPSASNLQHLQVTPKLIEDILSFEEELLSIHTSHKIGVCYVQQGQDDETQFLRNDEEDLTMEAHQFIDLLGEKVELEGFKGFSGGLDITKHNFHGKKSIYMNHHNQEVMYHVGPYIPCGAHDTQCIARKKHIGNDCVGIVFLEQGAKFEPYKIKSQHLHAWIIVEVARTWKQSDGMNESDNSVRRNSLTVNQKPLGRRSSIPYNFELKDVGIVDRFVDMLSDSDIDLELDLDSETPVSPRKSAVFDPEQTLASNTSELSIHSPPTSHYELQRTLTASKWYRITCMTRGQISSEPLPFPGIYPEGNDVVELLFCKAVDLSTSIQNGELFMMRFTGFRRQFLRKITREYL
ncbi:hypothetical protein PCE1_002581 [Barthelona sp. PCE]